ncbi:sensor histidine kinase [Microbacterium murale]|uniref:Oxygen sensor histidine kinase NreB n=1 Tax=Microbacterium murale TaxID=1081040 RepID=A0ABU0PAK5_9MICO|nr:sensor histidine kinase [Microbacterium murale]MDQ0643644.1 signal transduction histidine kinase [Microbacterium murale]
MKEDSAPGAQVADPDSRWLATVMHVAFFVLLISSLARFLIVHYTDPISLWVIVLAGVLALLYIFGPVTGPADDVAHPSPSTVWSRVWLAAVIASWAALVILAPSFGWCAVPLFYTALRTLRTRAAIALVVLVTALVVAAQVQLRLKFGFDPTLIFAPPAVAAVATAMFIYSQRQSSRLRTAIADLVQTRSELAATERREGTLAERQRLSMEIHDSLAQGLSSQQMLLQAADRLWVTDSDTAHRHVDAARTIAERNLIEARRFVHDLAPADLADGSGLDDALRSLAERETSESLRVRFHQDGVPPEPLPARIQSTLLRIAQGALANVREHADATMAVVTITYLDDQVVLDIADDGRGFDPAKQPEGVRGYGLSAMRARASQHGGTVTFESTPGEATVVSAAIPLGAATP